MRNQNFTIIISRNFPVMLINKSVYTGQVLLVIFVHNGRNNNATSLTLTLTSDLLNLRRDIQLYHCVAEDLFICDMKHCRLYLRSFCTDICGLFLLFLILFYLNRMLLCSFDTQVWKWCHVLQRAIGMVLLKEKRAQPGFEPGASRNQCSNFALISAWSFETDGWWN